MPRYTPVRASSLITYAGASDALRNLDRITVTLSTELLGLPVAAPSLLDALADRQNDPIDRELNNLMQHIEAFWQAPSASGPNRLALFAAHIEQALRNEAVVKSYEGDLGPDAVQCLPLTDASDAERLAAAHALFVKFNDATVVEIMGALVMSTDTGRTLLALPGSGLTEHTTQQAMRETVAGWLNDPTLRWALLINANRRHQDVVSAVTEDADLFLETFTAADVQLEPISSNPYRHGLQRQIDKQLADVRYVCGEGLSGPPELHAGQVEGAIKMDGLFTPWAILERREQALAESRLRKDLPDWIKLASPADLHEYAHRVRRYDQSREALSSALNGAQSAEQYAEVSLRASLANDLGYDLAPDTITVSTRRTLPLTGESYTLTRSLPRLALYGLHPDDDQDGSAFLTQTTISISGAPVGSAHARLTAAYLGELIKRLNLRASFAEYRDTVYARTSSQRLMREQFNLMVAQAAYAGKMQGHITAEDLALVDATSTSTEQAHGEEVSVQHIRINGAATLGKILLLRKQNARGDLERLLMFTSDAPRAQWLYGFHNETQLLHEIVSWASDADMSSYLLEQTQESLRPGVRTALEALSHKPFPEPGFLHLITQDSYDEALHTLVNALVDVTRSNDQAHTPDWYLHASETDRQRLVALEDATQGAIGNYKAKPHAQVEEFDRYVHRRASEKICQLLNVPAGTVDPDRIIITSPRETLTYTQMMRNGYDDSLGLLNPTADTAATFQGPEGIDLDALTPALVAGSVRGKWLADDYADLIRKTLLDPASPGYEYRRQASLLITQLQMQAAALRSYLKGQIDSHQYDWLEPAIANAHRSDAESRRRFPIYPLQIHVDKPFIASGLEGVDQLVVPATALTHVETVQGCVALLPTHHRLGALLYTPNAPDGVEFRLFARFVESLNQPGMIDYYKDRCRVNARRTLSFFLNDMRQGNANKSPVLPRDSIQDFAQTCFNRPLERKLREVEDATINRHDMLSQLVWNSLDLIAVVLTLPFPPASFAVGVALAFRDNFNALRALAGESPDEANLLIFTSLLNIAGAAGDYATGLKGFGAVMRKLGKNSTSGIRPMPLSNSARMPTRANLHPITLEEQPFLVSRPNAGQASRLYQSLGPDAEDVAATAHYAFRNNDGAWRPLGESPDVLPSISTGVSADRAVNISLSELPRVTEGHATGVSVGLGGKCYVEMNSLVYQVQYDAHLRCWHIVDPENPFAFFGRQPVSRDEQGQWRLIERSALRGGGKTGTADFTPLPSSSSQGSANAAILQEYELPKNLQKHMEHILNPGSADDMGIGLDEYFELYYAQMRQHFFLLKEKLYRDARAFFSFPAELPPRPSLPDVDASTTVSGFFESVYSRSNGLILSEAPKSIASKHLLMTHMQALVEQRVEVLYIPHLFTDKHVRKLAKYHDKGRNLRSGSHEIKNHLEHINGGALDNLSREHDYYHLIKHAHRHNIEVRPLSSSVSYPLDLFAPKNLAADPAAAEKMSKFFAHKILSADVAAEPSKRWIALVDQRLATYHQQTPGLAEMTAAISAHIEDLPAGAAPRISRTSVLVEVNAASTPSDFKLEFPTAELPAPGTPTTVTNPLDTALAGRPIGATGESTRALEADFRWEEGSGWKRVAPEELTTQGSPTALQQSFADTTYEMPIESRRILHDLAYSRRRGLEEEYFFDEVELVPVRERFFALRDKLNQDSRAITSELLPPRPVMPAIDPQTDTATFIERLYRQTDGMVVGEFHDSLASKKFIMDNLPVLARQDVKTLYMEHFLTDLHQAHLDRFTETGRMSSSLLDDIRLLDRGHLTDPKGVYTFENVIIKAQQHGLEIRAIDCAASYHIKGLRGSTGTTRQQMMNYFASRTIRRHQTVMGSHRWIALVGNSHSNTFADAVPGLAELEGAIGLRLVDVPHGTSNRISVDAGEGVRASLGTREEFLKGDFKVEIEVLPPEPGIRPPQPLPLEVRLSRPGMFVTEQQPGNLHFIIHKSRDGQIHRTPVKINTQGKVYLERPTWPGVHLQPYDDVDALVVALEEINLTRVG